ncbi:MAG TPA: APC family permease [Streptosporangiaceae bacterium]|nr:APC family permease [Streptosporangiaceae bacterium]
MATDTAAVSTRPVDVGLKREIGFIGATWSSETSLIGSGWLFGSFFAAQAIGPSAIWAWMVAGIAIIILALVHAELGGMFPVAGGTARFPHLAFGSGAGISFGFFSWLQAVTVAPIECYAVIRYGQFWLDSAKINVLDPVTGNATHLGFVVVIVLMAIMTAINFLAMRVFARINNVITYWKVAIPILAIIILLFKFHPHNFSVQGGLNPGNSFGLPGPGGVGWHAFFYAIPGASIVFAYLGFEQADQLAGEVKNPQRNLPLALISAIVIGTIIYVLLQVAFIGAAPEDLIKNHLGFGGISAKNPIAIGPFAGLASVVGIGWLAIILRLDAFISPYGTGQIYVTSTSRVGYGLARNRYYPSMFTRTDKNGVPWFSLIISFLFGLVFLLPFPSWHSLVGLVTSASVLMYAGAPLSLGAFRKVLPDANRPYKMPGAAVIGPIAFIVSSLIIYWSGFDTIWKLGVCIILGYLFILMYFADNPHAPKVHWKKSAWLAVYLIGMGIISWQGQFGTLNTSRIPFWWDMGLVAVFSLVIYFWAIYSAQSRAEMEQAIIEQAGGTDDWEAQVAEAAGAAETPAT